MLIILNACLGEETLTDLLVFEMPQFWNSNAFRIHHPTRRQESWCGFDILVRIRRNDGLSRFLTIHAKKLYRDGNYKALNHRTPSGARQIDLLPSTMRGGCAWADGAARVGAQRLRLSGSRPTAYVSRAHFARPTSMPGLIPRPGNCPVPTEGHGPYGMSDLDAWADKRRARTTA